MKKKFRLVSLASLACACVLGSLCIIQEAQGAFSIAVGGRIGGGAVAFQYDSAGFPIWGHTPAGYPIYAYSPAGAPIIVMNGIYGGCYVPTWGPAHYYRGPYCWPSGVYRRPYCPPPPRFRPCPPPYGPGFHPGYRPGFRPGPPHGHHHHGRR